MNVKGIIMILAALCAVGLSLLALLDPPASRSMSNLLNAGILLSAGVVIYLFIKKKTDAASK